MSGEGCIRTLSCQAGQPCSRLVLVVVGLAIVNLILQDFGKRLERDIKKSVNARIEHTTSLTGQTVGL